MTTEAESTVSTSGWLRLYGRLDWAKALELLQDFTCAYADYGGFHVGSAPSGAPPYSHLWAWRDQRMFRFRIDGSEALVSSLSTTHDPDGEPVAVVRRSALTWRLDEGRIGRQDPAVLPGRMNLWHVIEDQPIAFISSV